MTTFAELIADRPQSSTPTRETMTPRSRTEKLRPVERKNRGRGTSWYRALQVAERSLVTTYHSDLHTVMEVLHLSSPDPNQRAPYSPVVHKGRVLY